MANNNETPAYHEPSRAPQGRTPATDGEQWPFLDYVRLL